MVINIYKGNEKFYDNFLMPTIHKFLSPELSHQLAIFACKHKLFPKQSNIDPDTLVLY